MLENGTSIENVTVPYLDILSFEWAQNPESHLSTELQKAVVHASNCYLNISVPTSPLLGMNMEGLAAPLKTTTYPIANDFTWPSPYMFHG